MVELGKQRGMSPARVATLVVLFACLTLMGIMGYRLLNPAPDSQIEGAARINGEGREVAVKPHSATNFSLQAYGGETISLSGLRGKVVVLNFWSSWCPPCKDEAPVLERVWQRYKDKNVMLLGVNVWDKGPAARQFLLEQGITYPNGAPTAPVAAEYGLTGIPETYVIDPKGMVVRHWNGPLSDSELTELIASALPTTSSKP